MVRNLAGYSMAMVPTWLILRIHCCRWGIRRVYVVYLTVLPVLVSLSSYGVYQFWIGAGDAVTRGFSGAVAACLGLLFVSVLKIGYDARGWPGVIGLAGANVLVVLVRMLIRGGGASADILVFGVGGALLWLSLGRNVGNREGIPEDRLSDWFEGATHLP